MAATASNKLAAKPLPLQKSPAEWSAKKPLSAYKFQAQTKFYFCGPASTRLALTQRGKTASQKTLTKKPKSRKVSRLSRLIQGRPRR